MVVFIKKMLFIISTNEMVTSWEKSSPSNSHHHLEVLLLIISFLYPKLSKTRFPAKMKSVFFNLIFNALDNSTLYGITTTKTEQVWCSLNVFHAVHSVKTFISFYRVTHLYSSILSYKYSLLYPLLVFQLTVVSPHKMY